MSFKSFFICTCVIFVSIENSAFAVTKDYKKIFLSSIASRRIKPQNFGIAVHKYDPQTNSFAPVFLQNENLSYTPASITKALTAAGLLDLHGAGKKIATRVYAQKKPTSAILNSDLFVKGAGDPTMVSEKLWLLVNEIKKWGIKSIYGDIVFDDTAFDAQILDGDRSKWNQRAYNASITALALNWNAVRVRFLNAAPLKIVTDPYNPYFDLRPKKKLRLVSQVELRPSRTSEVLSAFFGKDALKKEMSIYRRVVKPRLVFQNQFLDFLKAAGIQHKGEIKWKKAPLSSLVEIGKIKSVDMSSIIKLMMKHSNNFIADMLTKYSFNEQTGRQGSYAGGLALLKARIQNLSPFKNEFSYVSASGLSRSNKVSPADMTRLLTKIEQQSYYPEFLSSFPLSCVDGTLKERICMKPGLVRAKTGLLAGVSSLAGFARSSDGKDKYIFTMIYNGKSGDQFDAKSTIDSFWEKVL